MNKRPSVLVVESRQNTRTFLEMTLSQEGMCVFSAINLASALLQLRVLRPDLIIVALDRRLLVDGAAVAQIKALTEAPVLALAADGEDMPWPGIADILPYPIKAGQLRSKVAGLLGGL
jgi:DNA-binding response OmpR family regulator